MFVVCGEALMDVFATGSTPAGLTLDARAGGSPLNVAIGLARMGQPVMFLGALSEDSWVTGCCRSSRPRASTFGACTARRPAPP